MKRRLHKYRRVLGVIGAVAALAIAIIYLKVIPSEAAGTSGIQHAVLQYAHSACWFMLSGASLLWAIGKKNKWTIGLTYAALGTYAVFLGTLLLTKI